MNWAEAGIWNSVLFVSESVVIALCTCFFQSNTSRDVKSGRAIRCIAVFLYWTGLLGLDTWLRETEYGTYATAFFLIAGSMTAGHFLYNRSRIYLFFYALFPVTVMVLQLFVIYLAVGYISVRYGMAVFDYYMANIVLILKQLMEILLTGIWVVVLNRKKFENITGVQFAGLLFPPAVSVFTIFILCMTGNVYFQMYGIFLFVLDIVLLVCMNVYVWYLFSYQSKNRRLKEELEISKKQNELQYQYYKRMEEKQKASRKIFHDIRNHLQSVEGLYLDGETEAGNTYAKDLQNILASLDQTRYTNHRMLNIILGDKAETARKRRIHLEVQIGEIHLEHMKDMDVTTIFSNLLDNALEAAGQAGSNRFIQIKGDRFQDFTVIKIRNSIGLSDEKAVGERKTDFVKTENGFRKTIGKTAHAGIGLQNVKRTLEQYGGGILTEEEDAIFSVSITLPVPQENQLRS